MSSVRSGLAGSGIFSARVIVAGLTGLMLFFGMYAAAHANAKYAGIVIDAKTGETLYADRADVPRYPASLTKMMTLYMTFESLNNGRITKSTRIPVSRNAAAEEPTKLWLKPGQTITVDQAMYSLVTRSANDAATALGEYLGGSEDGFARMMTARARELGMRSTTFKNAHGLPDRGQKTTARDMAILGLALRDHYPEYYSYFKTRSFTYKGNTYGNHNKLLVRVKGVDGIKTGYINASGFNLVSSVQSNGRSIVAVVMGGRTGASRDAHMADLIKRYLPKASRGQDRFSIGSPASGSLLVSVKLPTTNIPIPASRPSGDTAMAYTQEVVKIEDGVPLPATRPRAPDSPAEALDMMATGSTANRGWAIQIGSMPSREQAETMHALAEASNPALSSAVTAFIEPVQIKGETYHRARYTGFASKAEARNACKALKQKKISCYAIEIELDQQS